MNLKWSIIVACLGLAAIARDTAAQDGGIAAIGPRLITYQGLVENAGGPIDNQSLVVEFRAFTALEGGTQRGLTVSQVLSASAIRQGVFSVEMDADELALPDNADETFLEVSVCSPAPCSPVVLAPRHRVTHAALAVSARNLGGAAYADSFGALRVGGSGANAGMMEAQRDLGGGVTQALRADASTAAISASRSDGPTAISMESRAPNGIERTYLRLDHAAAQVSFSREVDATAAAGITPPPKLTLSLLDGENPSVAAFSGPDAAAFDLKFGSQAAMRIGEDPETPGEAVMMVGPEGLLLTEDALASESNVAAALSNYVRLRIITAAQGDAAQGGAAAAALASKLQMQSVSGGVPTTLLEIDAATRAATFYGTEGVSAARVKIDNAIASNVAGSGASAELSVNMNGNVELKVGNEIVDRWSPEGDTAQGVAPNRISGSKYNYILPGSIGAVVLGGGSRPLPSGCDTCVPGEPLPPVGTGCMIDCSSNEANRVTYSLGTVAGGVANEAHYFATVGGGDSSRATARSAVIAGGAGNKASGESATISGGQSNQALGTRKCMGGDNDGVPCFAISDCPNGGCEATCKGGANDGNPCVNDPACTPGGTCGYGAKYGVVGGGRQNTIGPVGGEAAVIAGGNFNETQADWSVVGGGHTNYGAVNAPYSTIAGGRNNQIEGQYGVIGGGYSNLVGGTTGFAATVPGGYDNNALGDYSFAAGRRAYADVGHHGTFVWADSQDLDLKSTGTNQFIVRAVGGMYLGADSTVSIPSGTFLNTSTGGYLSNTGVWTDSSDRDKKENFQPLDGLDVLERLSDLTVSRWNFKESDASIQHIGPVAQDFYAAFGVGSDDKHIAPLDTAGVALAAIQGLYEVVQEKECRIGELEAQNRQLEARLSMIEEMLHANGGGK